MILKREEIECGHTLGMSVITPLHHGSEQRRPAYQEAPFDLLYGVRGRTHNVDLLSPYEMLLHWSLERIEVPTKKMEKLRAQRGPPMELPTEKPAPKRKRSPDTYLAYTL